jgi:DNA (cytosine-5)-methyltransferase 1
METIPETVGEVVRTHSFDVRKMNGTTRTHIDLFSGIGGFALACMWLRIQTIAFCEIEKYAQRVLRKNFPGVRILEDVRSFPATEFRKPWLLTGGYPCQPFSQAGKRRGTEDDRHLWPEMFRIIRSSKPVWVLCENVAGHITMGLDEVISDLEGEEYSVQSFVIPAQAVDARHRRDRVWIIANSEIKRDCRKNEYEECFKQDREEWFQRQPRRDSSLKVVSDTDDPRFKERRRSESVQSEHHSLECSCEDLADSNRSGQEPSRNDWGMGGIGQSIENSRNNDFERWLPEPDVGRVAHGIPNRVDRLKGLGNAIVPQVAYQIIRTMIESEEQFIGEQHENQP